MESIFWQNVELALRATLCGKPGQSLTTLMQCESRWGRGRGQRKRRRRSRISSFNSEVAKPRNPCSDKSCSTQSQTSQQTSSVTLLSGNSQLKLLNSVSKIYIFVSHKFLFNVTKASVSCHINFGIKRGKFQTVSRNLLSQFFQFWLKKVSRKFISWKQHYTTKIMYRDEW